MTRDLRGLDAIGAVKFVSKTATAAAAPVVSSTAKKAAAPAPTAAKVISTTTAQKAATPSAAKVSPVAQRAAAPTASKVSPVAQKAAADAAKKPAALKIPPGADVDALQRAGNRALAVSRKIAKRYPQAASKLASSGQKALSSAKKVKAAKAAAKTTVKGDQISGILREVMGLDFSFSAATTDMMADLVSSFVVDAQALAGEILTSLMAIDLNQLSTVSPPLVQQGQLIMQRCQNAIAADPTDSSIIATVNGIQADANAWLAQVHAAIAAPSTPPSSLDSGATGGGSSSGGGGGGGGGDEGGGGEDTGGGGDEDGGEQGGGGTGEGGAPSDAGDSSYTNEYEEAEESADDTSSFEESADESDAEDASEVDETGEKKRPEDDIFSDIVGELLGRPRLRVLGANTQVIPSASTASTATAKASWLDYFHKPLWTGSPVQIWQAGVGAGAAIAVSSVLLAVFRRRR